MQQMVTMAIVPAFAKGRHAIGIDVGGTKIAGAIVNLTTGAIAGRVQVPTQAHRGSMAVLEAVAAMARGLFSAATVLHIQPVMLGIGVAELVDRKGRVFSDYRIKWQGLDVQAVLSAGLSDLGPLEITVASDVRAAALAEARFGAGLGIYDFYYVTIGTGISGVLVQNGVPYSGSRGAALVIANGRSTTHCAACGHVTSQVVEDIASGPAIAAAFAPGCRAEDVLLAASAQNPKAIAIIDHATGELGRSLALIADALDPACLIIGGGLGSAPGRYFESLTRAIRAGLWDGGDHHLPILQAALGSDAGLIGAAIAASLTQEPAQRPTTQST